MADISIQLLDGAQASAEADELQALHAEVYGPDDGAFAGRFRVQRRQPGFVLAEARNGGFLVGYAFGMPLRPSTSWWRQLTAPLPDEVTAEHPGRTFALADLAVRASWRRQGIGRDLHDLILRSRPEERATGRARARRRPGAARLPELGLAQGGPDPRRRRRRAGVRRTAHHAPFGFIPNETWRVPRGIQQPAGRLHRSRVMEGLTDDERR